MEENQTNLPKTDLEELVGRVTEELRPLVAGIVKKFFENKQVPVTKDIDEHPVTDEVTNDKSCIEIASDVKLLLEKVDILVEDDRKFNKMHDELDEYRKGLYRKLLSPILKNIIAQYSKVSDLFVFYDNKQKEENVDYTQLFTNLLKEYKNIELGLSDLLYDYDIEIIEPKEGDEFNPKMHKAIKTILTDDVEKERKIAACVTLGFKDVSANDQIVKYPEVEIFKLNQ